MADSAQRPIVIKRIKKGGHEHHGGAWKIAYADFVTAMMAFFLLMWLLGSTTKAQRRGISEYFQTPLKVALLGGEGSGDATSLVKGGGDDLTKTVGQDNNRDGAPAGQDSGPDDADVSPSSAPTESSRRAAEMALEKREKALLEDLKLKLEKAIDSNPMLKQYKSQILLDLTAEGLRVQIVDEKNRPMFANGSARMQIYTSPILREIGKTLNQVSNRISLAGHTDATIYAGGERGYSNWELSSDRANASRRELVAGGMEDSKIMRVVGLASAVPFDKADLFNPINRRISIIVMKHKAEAAIRNEGKESVNVSDTEEAKKQVLQQPGGGEA
ncbi:MAG: flagellar motor protein MotB, partial [Azonexus sp.]